MQKSTTKLCPSRTIMTVAIFVQNNVDESATVTCIFAIGVIFIAPVKLERD